MFPGQTSEQIVQRVGWVLVRSLRQFTTLAPILVFLWCSGTSQDSVAVAMRQVGSEKTATNAPQDDAPQNQASEKPASEKPASEKPAPAADAVPDPIQEAVKRGVRFLESQQKPNGSWRANPGPENFDAGVTALATLALLRAGQSPQSDAVKKGLPLVTANKSTLTYAVALQTLAICAAGEFDRDVVEQRVKWLVDTQAIEGPAAGGWSYGPNRTTRADGSCTRFAVWALDAARRRGVKAPDETWRRIAEYWLSSQHENGGWGYVQSTTQPTLTMTLAGIACLESVRGAVPEEDLHRRIDAAVERAWKWHETMGGDSKAFFRQGSFLYYRLHSRSLAGRQSNHPMAGSLDWQAEVTKELLRYQNAETGEWKGDQHEHSLVATSFAILVLRPTEVSDRPGEKKTNP